MSQLFWFPTKNIQKASQEKQRGQVAIFIALIFQVLFVFFAMLVNVGLLVHHKINLQNSVDIAAYYGAMKQAEKLNVIAHANFQIRQSWKLLVFRYRHLGAYGDDTFPGKTGGINLNTKGSIFPSFCIAYDPFDFMNTSENYCRKSGQGSSFILQKPPVPTFVGAGAAAILGLQAFAQLNIAATNAVRNAITHSCKEKNALNYYELTNFIYAWKRDIANRKRLIYTLANEMSSSNDDFKDLDGKSVIDGVEKTFQKNLTYQNLQGVQNIGTRSLKFFNSLGGTATGDPLTPPAWLSDIRIFPIFWAFISTDCTKDAINYAPFPVNFGLPIPPTIATDPNVGSVISQINDYVGEPATGASSQALLYGASLGVEKNPWYVPYVGVHAETKPQIPFSPFGSVTLKATAYAKVFGGTVGPWYGKKWNFGSQQSDSATPNDTKVMPPRSTGALLTPLQVVDPQFVPDDVRYVGDTIGTQSNLNMYTYAQVMKQFPTHSLSLLYWAHLVNPIDDLEQIGTNGDLLAWHNPGITNLTMADKMRNLENAVIAPDQWDLSYYSVEPDYYRNYYLRLKKREAEFKFPVRGDLGQRANDSILNNYSIKEQIKNAQTFSLSGGLDIKNALNYYAQSPAELLTSFKGMAPDNPVMDTINNFGKCTKSVLDGEIPEKSTAGNCISGGRVGYSVKLVDGDFLSSSDLPMGGPMTSGPLKNPPAGF